MTTNKKITEYSAPASPAKLDAYLDQLATRLPTAGRLIFALDATASRQPTWDEACKLTADMFEAAAAGGNIEIQVVFYKGPLGTCKASGWMTDAKQLSSVMAKITCEGGHTQIEKVLSHACRQHDKVGIAAVVFVGDAMEEKLDSLCSAAGKLRVPGFMFLEGGDEIAEQAFREIARISRGAFAKFDSGAADQLKELLRAVAAYASGGLQALEGKPGATLLLEQLKHK